MEQKYQDQELRQLVVAMEQKYRDREHHRQQLVVAMCQVGHLRLPEAQHRPRATVIRLRIIRISVSNMEEQLVATGAHTPHTRHTRRVVLGMLEISVTHNKLMKKMETTRMKISMRTRRTLMSIRHITIYMIQRLIMVSGAEKLLILIA